MGSVFGLIVSVFLTVGFGCLLLIGLGMILASNRTISLVSYIRRKVFSFSNWPETQPFSEQDLSRMNMLARWFRLLYYPDKYSGRAHSLRQVGIIYILVGLGMLLFVIYTWI